MLTIPGRVPITIHPLFWLLALFIGWMSTFNLSGTLLAVLVIFYSVLFHEFGHALTALCFEQKARIQLAVFGGFTYREGRKLRLWEEFFIVLNGPLAGFLLCVGAFLLWRHAAITSPALLFMVKYTALVNLFWTVVNLIPVMPLDGGHLLSICLEGIFGFRGIKMAIIIGLAISVSVSALLFIFGYLLAGALFLILTFESFRSLRYYKLFKEQDRDSGLQQLFKSAQEDMETENYTAALSKLEAVRERAKEGVIYTVATQEIASIYRRKGLYKEAYELLIPIRNTLSGDTVLLLHYLAYKNADYKTVTELGDKSYQSSPTYETALRNALAYGALSEVEPAMGWLECALREGAPSLKEVIKKSQFDSIRNEPAFRSFEESLPS